MSFLDVITFFGGLGIFIFGMKIMADGLEKAAGDKMQKIIGIMTSNIFKSVLVGTVVTALVQSSSATTVMVVGFVNAGLMRLTQAVGIIMGANIGTTITSQILRLGDIDQGVWYLQILKPSTVAPLAVAAGVALVMFAKKKKMNIIGEIFTGFGLLFIGMGIMEGALYTLRYMPQFQDAFAAFSNPVLGLLIGAAITALLQSSSASVGILQAVSAAGLVTFSSAAPIILGQNIGTCITALLSAVGANKNAKKAAFIHLIFNTVGSVIFLVLIYGYQRFIGFSFWDAPLNRGGIADFHIIFNISNTLILLPFAGILVRLSHTFIRGKDEPKDHHMLDERFLSTPAVAVSQVLKEVVRMNKVAKHNVKLSIDSVFKASTANNGRIEDNENLVDEMESNITRYLVKLSDEPLNKEEHKKVSGIFHVITDIERIADHAINIAELNSYILKEGIEFSDLAKEELKIMSDAIKEIMALTVEAYDTQDVEAAKQIQPCEDVIDLLKEKLRVRHIDRLAQQKCNLKAGVVFLDIVNNLERIADHCSNIGVSVEQVYSDRTDFDPHEYLKHLHMHKTKEYEQAYKAYEEKYKIEE